MTSLIQEMTGRKSRGKMRVDCFGAIAPRNDGMNFYKSDAKSDI